MDSITKNPSPSCGEAGFHASCEELVCVSLYDWTKRTVDFDGNWRFSRGELPGAQEVCYDDSAWCTVSLPHDYSIDQPYSQSMEAESGYLPGGVGWYRNCFYLPEELSDRRFRLDFDGVYMNASVWINGAWLGTHPYGYTPFSFDLTPHLIYGRENLLAVKVDHRTPSSRWYSGSGIYRSVALTVTGQIHVALNGITVLTPHLKEEAGGPVTLQITTAIDNSSDRTVQIYLTHTVYRKDDPKETPIGIFSSEQPITLLPGKSCRQTCGLITSDRPELWSPEAPCLYVVKTQLRKEHRTEDCCLTDFGFRFFSFDPDGGFFLNGRPLKLKGVCLHHDQGSLGAAAYRRAMERQLELLADMGCNSIRVTHNPAAKTLIDLCNQKGFLVIEELFDGWHGSKNGNTEDYGKWYGQPIEAGNAILGRSGSVTWEELDIKSTIMRDINAPSIILWSLGNEVMEGIGIDTADYPKQAEALIGWAREADRSRPVTTGDNRLKLGQPESVLIGELLTRAEGAVGFNYTSLDILDAFHRDHPSWRIYGAETASSINSRGVYAPALYDRQYTAYDESHVAWGHCASQAWYDTIRKDYVAGGYVWTGFDYIGEPTNYNGIGPGAASLPWPSPKNSYFGIIDTAGFPKDSYYLYQSLWNDRVQTVHLLPAWNGDSLDKDESGKVKVVVYSNARSVELFFTPSGGGNRSSFGKKTFAVRTSEGGRYTYQYYEGTDGEPEEFRNLYLTWRIPYEDGTLQAVGYDEKGTVIPHTSGRSTVTTAGAASRVVLTADRTVIEAGQKDLCYVTADITDDRGNLVFDANHRIDFNIRGEGVIAGVDNGLSVDHDPYQADSRRAFGGKALAIVRSAKTAGSFTLKASSDGLEGAAVTVTVREAPRLADLSFRLIRNYYISAGQAPHLPCELAVYGLDGATDTRALVWEDLPEVSLRQPGHYILHGKAGNLAVSVNLHVAAPIAAVLNYSATVPIGTAPLLPAFLQGVDSTGQAADTPLPTTWKEPEADAYGKEGLVVIHGHADAFGLSYPATASIRVQARQYAITADVASKAKRLQTVSGASASAALLFTYDTQELLGRARLSFAFGNHGLSCPAPGTTKWYLSNVGPDGPWTPLPTRETVEEASDAEEMRRYTYDFTPVMATCLRLEPGNPVDSMPDSVPGLQPDGDSRNAAAATGLTAVELFRAEASTTAGHSAHLGRVLLDGTPVPADALAGGAFHASVDTVLNLDAAGEENAAVTVLPAHEGIIRILSESEDHEKREEFRIYLQAAD